MEALSAPVNSFGEIVLPDEAATVGLADRIAPYLASGDALLLQGDLGVGKTSFTRALIRALAGYEVEVPSPTFTLVQLYDLPETTLWHFDLYRLKQPDEVYELGWEDAQVESIVVVEWPERLGGLKPANALTLRFGFAGEGRSVVLEGNEVWQHRLKDPTP